MRRSGLNIPAVIAAIVVSLVAASRVWGQVPTGTLSGIVVDPVGAVVPDVAVLLIGSATALKRETKTDAEGAFSFPVLPPGTYTLRATSAGFSPFEVPAVVITATEPVTLRVQLKVEGLSESVVVTAQKREERIQDVPISMAVLTADELSRRKVTAVDDLAAVVPGVSVTNTGNQHRIVLRGVSNISGSSSALIGMYEDEADITSVPNTHLNPNIYDLERVEVLRGPQGTLYGQGSMGGTIRFVTRDPILDRVEVTGDITAQLTESGSPGDTLNATLNLPIVEKVLGVRLATSLTRGGGWINQPAAGRTDYNSDGLTNLRLKTLWRPSASLTVRGLVELHRNETAPNAGEDGDGNYMQSHGLTVSPAVGDDHDIYNVSAEYQLPAVRILSSTSYLNQDHISANYGYRYPISPAPDPLLDVLLVRNNNFIQSASQEVRVSSTSQGPWRWSGGGVYRDFTFDVDLYRLAGRVGTVPAPLIVATRTVSKSWALFGEAGYDVTNRLAVGAGLRRSVDDQTFTNPATQTATFSALNPRFYASYKPTANINTYGSVSKGFRGGGFNSQTTTPPYGPESIWTYEVGTKATILPRAGLTLDVAVFYSDYHDYQIIGLELFPPFRSYTQNSGSIKLTGIEWASGWQPSRDWHVDFGGTYVDSRFYKLSVTGADHAIGDPLDFTSRYSVATGVQHDATWMGRRGYARVDYYVQGPQTYRNRSIGSFHYSQSDVVRRLNAQASLGINNRLSLALIAENILNDRGTIDPLEIQASAARARPRSVALRLSVGR